MIFQKYTITFRYLVSQIQKNYELVYLMLRISVTSLLNLVSINPLAKKRRGMLRTQIIL